jgi:uncharacterized protein (TIGR00375 family)
MSGLRTWFADLHVHIGRTDSGQPVKISASRDLTFHAIAREASERKGISLIGVIDCHSPGVQADIERHLATGEMREASGGGIRYRDTVLLLGTEMEVREESGGPFHLLGFLPDLASMKSWTAWLAPRMKNVQLSSQRVRATARELQAELLQRGGLLVPAHIFTPHRGLLGCAADRLAERLEPDGIAAVELGLSADCDMADRISELGRYPFLTNSDAHSAGMIGRECNELLMAEPSFAEWKKALLGLEGRRIVANYGLHPALGKYHATYCTNCRKAIRPSPGSQVQPETDGSAAEVCPACGSRRLVRGVAGRVAQLADRDHPLHPDDRPPYRPQVPLSFVPGVGRAMRERLLREIGTEMEVLHRASEKAIASVAGPKVAAAILAARTGRISFVAGSGGVYGKIADTTF